MRTSELRETVWAFSAAWWVVVSFFFVAICSLLVVGRRAASLSQEGRAGRSP
jgi:hypothetical protein